VLLPPPAAGEGARLDMAGADEMDTDDDDGAEVDDLVIVAGAAVMFLARDGVKAKHVRNVVKNFMVKVGVVSSKVGGCGCAVVRPNCNGCKDLRPGMEGETRAS
jgi:hypothetical protein